MVMVWLVSDYRFPIQKAIKKTILLKIAVAWFLSFLSFFFSFVCLRILCRCFIFFIFMLTKQNFYDSSSIEIFFFNLQAISIHLFKFKKCFECQPPIVCHWHWLHRIFSFRFVSFCLLDRYKFVILKTVSQCEIEREKEKIRSWKWKWNRKKKLLRFIWYLTWFFLQEKKKKIIWNKNNKKNCRKSYAHCVCARVFVLTE